MCHHKHFDITLINIKKLLDQLLPKKCCTKKLMHVTMDNKNSGNEVHDMSFVYDFYKNW